MSISRYRQVLAHLSQVHVASTCARTGGPLIEGHPLLAPSIDAIDPSKLHVLTNVHIVCRGYNFGKRDYNMTEFDTMLHGLLVARNNSIMTD